MLAFATSPVLAGSIGGSGTVTGDGYGNTNSNTGAGGENNDEEGGENPNWMTANVTVTGWGAIDKIFPYTGPTGGVTEYPMMETITNGLNFNITDYHLELGWMIDGTYAPSLGGDNLDFDWSAVGGPSNTPPPTSTALTTIVNFNDEDLLDYFSSGAADVVVPGGSFQITFNVDVPDAPPNTTDLVIRQWATPEPSSFVLLIIGAISAMAYGWRRRRVA